MKRHLAFLWCLKELMHCKQHLGSGRVSFLLLILNLRGFTYLYILQQHAANHSGWESNCQSYHLCIVTIPRVVAGNSQCAAAGAGQTNSSLCSQWSRGMCRTISFDFFFPPHSATCRHVRLILHTPWRSTLRGSSSRPTLCEVVIRHLKNWRVK